MYPAEEQGVIASCNYGAFVPEKFEPWLNFEESPPLGRKAPGFPLRDLNGKEMRLGELWSEHACTIVEFGSFT